jgi:hypothetical protein
VDQADECVMGAGSIGKTPGMQTSRDPAAEQTARRIDMDSRFSGDLCSASPLCRRYDPSPLFSQGKIYDKCHPNPMRVLTTDSRSLPVYFDWRALRGSSLRCEGLTWLVRHLQVN